MLEFIEKGGDLRRLPHLNPSADKLFKPTPTGPAPGQPVDASNISSFLQAQLEEVWSAVWSVCLPSFSFMFAHWLLSSSCSRCAGATYCSHCILPARVPLSAGYRWLRTGGNNYCAEPSCWCRDRQGWRDDKLHDSTVRLPNYSTKGELTKCRYDH